MEREKADIVRDDDNLQTILICAVRYSLGRVTYMPGLVTDWIMGNCKGKLSRKTLSVMLYDIYNVRRENGLGMDCDEKTWMRFYEWLKGETDAGQGESDQGS